MASADPLAAANEEAEKVRARSIELIHQTQERVQQMRDEIEQEAADRAAESDALAEEVLEDARARAAAILAEAEERKASRIAETETRVQLIEEEAIQAGIEAVNADRAKYKESITDIVNQSLVDARALIANGEEQAKEIVEQAAEIKAEAEAMRAKAEDALHVAEADAEEKRQHAAGMLEAIERLKAQLQERAAEQGIADVEG